MKVKMKYLQNLFIYIILTCSQLVYSQKSSGNDANIVGHVVNNEGEHIPFATITVKGTTIGTTTDETGHYQLINLPEKNLIIIAQSLGYKPKQVTTFAKAGQTNEVKFELEQDILNLEEIVVSADRGQLKRTEAPVIVNTLSPKLFNSSHAVSIGESLNFSPGLRLENNCQNCGFTQVRMNGMEGPYTQVLINSRPIFSGLAGVYGLELIPSNMVEKVEVVRGGGSALYGNNAIAGTINIILKEPDKNTWEVGSNYTLNGVGMESVSSPVPDISASFNTSIVSDDHKNGISLYGFTRDRKPFDANDDGYSEISLMNNLTFGTRLFQQLGHRNKLSVDFFNIREEREGGNNQYLPLHERNIAEAVKHDMKAGALTYEQYFRNYDLLSVYASGQLLKRDSYYGANQSLKDYGFSGNKIYNIGLQYKAVLDHVSFVAGIENTGDFLRDEKLGYPDYDNATIEGDSIQQVPHVGNTLVANQSLMTLGAFAQYEISLKKTKIALGGRFEKYEVNDHAKEGADPRSRKVFTPRVSLMHEIFNNLKARVSYSQGYRAPQIFDEDLHIETSGSRQVINVNHPDLKQEFSHSLMTSIDFNGLIGYVNTGLLIEGFYTRLLDPFVNIIGTPDENGIVYYTRENADEGAVVKGLNIELKLKPMTALSFTSGFTFQTSRYDVPQQYRNREFTRTPDNYGFFAIDWDFATNFCLSSTATYTGSMLVPYFGPEPKPGDPLRETSDFFDMGLKLSYNVKVNNSTLQLFGGIKNMFDAYQSDFDSGINRDPAYIYGPITPRSVYCGLRLGNFLK